MKKKAGTAVFAIALTIGVSSFADFAIGNNTITSPQGTATVNVTNPASMTRHYNLSTTAPLRDNYPSNKVVSYDENSGQMITRTGNNMFDALFALALYENRLNSVTSITNSDYNYSQPIQEPNANGFFQTGAKWTYVWTRDTSYSVFLSLAMVDPLRSKNSLLFKISNRRDVQGAPEIIQDTGSGGSWPISSDRVVWSLGAQELLNYLTGNDRQDFFNQAYPAIINTIESDRQVVYDKSDGLYTGETSFLDWREQTYPTWTASNTVHIGMSKTLSTNVCHYIILSVASQMAAEKGDTASNQKYAQWAAALKKSINDKFWLPSEGLYSMFLTTTLDQSPVTKYDLMGESLAILSGVADPQQAKSIMQNYPHTEMGVSVIWPQQPLTRPYHNRAMWPFASAYCLKAAKVANNDAVASHNIFSLMTAAATNLSNMENMDFQSLYTGVDDDDPNATAVDSQRQLWSVAGYISMVTDIIFGRETSQKGIRFTPFITKQVRNTLFSGTNTINLYNLNYRGKIINIQINLPQVAQNTQGYYQIASEKLNGTAINSSDYISDATLQSSNNIEITLADNNIPGATMNLVNNSQPWEMFYSPKEPSLESITPQNGLLKLTFSTNGESDNPLINIYRNSVKVAQVSGTSWTDPNSGDYNKNVYFYTIESEFSGNYHNRSQHTEPQGYWTDGTVETIYAGDSRLMSPQGASMSLQHGQYCYNNWGTPTDTLEAKYTPTQSGTYSLQLSYANNMGPVNTGITCCVKKVQLYDSTNSLIEEACLFMPQMSTWDVWSDSSFFPKVKLSANQTYKIIISDYRNMSYFQSNALYNNVGGMGGITNRCNLEGIKVLLLSQE